MAFPVQQRVRPLRLRRGGPALRKTWSDVCAPFGFEPWRRTFRGALRRSRRRVAAMAIHARQGDFAVMHVLDPEMARETPSASRPGVTGRGLALLRLRTHEECTDGKRQDRRDGQ